MEVLSREMWSARAEAHAARVDAAVEPHLRRRTDGVKHPVHDFLFTYYSQRPAQLRRWHPGFGVRLLDAPEYDGLKGYADGAVAASYVAGQERLVRTLAALLRATLDRPAQLGCFGLHEWAMVYRLDEDETRHADWPLRLGPRGTDRVVESHRIACTHFDAYRFFTESAAPRNALTPTRERQTELEQPGCLHANMDLYKWAYKLAPGCPSDLTADCFELAVDVRELDMRASPYDLAAHGYTPVRIETPEGRADYARAQAGFAERAAPLRRRLMAVCASLTH